MTQELHPQEVHVHDHKATSLNHRRVELDVVETPHYLLRTGILSAEDILVGNLRVEDISRRNRNFRVVMEDGRGFLVKQPMGKDDRVSLQREANMLRTIHGDSLMRGMRPYTPTFVHYDPFNQVLVTELIHPATSITKLHLHYGKIEFPPEGAETAARILATFHKSGGDAVRKDRVPFLEMQPTNGLSILYPQVFGSAGQTGWEYWKLLEGEPHVTKLAEVVRRYKECNGIVHGDARWDNFLLTHGELNGGMNLRLIDWEMARVGDPMWDVTCFLGDYIRFWAIQAKELAHRNKKGDDPAAMFAEPPFAWGLFHESARTFWETYCKQMRFSAKRRREAFARLLDYLPYHYVMFGWEALKGAADGGNDEGFGLVQRLAATMAARMAREPQTTFKEVYGFAEE